MRKRKSLRKKPADPNAAAAHRTPSIATAGEVFADGSSIELIRVPGGNPKLMLWDGTTETVGALVEHAGHRYEPVRFDGTLLRELTLPTECRPHGTTRELLADVCKLVEDLVGLPEQFATLTGRFVLCDWLVEAMQVAPALSIFGLDATKGKRLLTLLHCLCRHGLRLTEVTPAGLRSLPTRAGFTLLISQPTVSDALVRMLDHASRRDLKIPFRGGLLDLFGAQVIHANPVAFDESLSVRAIRIPMVPGGPQLPDFDVDVQHGIAANLQGRLLGFRRANLRAACNLRYDASRFVFSMRDLAHGFAAATPDDAALQAGVFDLLQDQDQEIRNSHWTGLCSVTVEAVVVACRESLGGLIYVGDLAAIAQEILLRRGGYDMVVPSILGKELKSLGFRTEPRDAKGFRLRLTEDVYQRAQQIARNLCPPERGGAASKESAGAESE